MKTTTKKQAAKAVKKQEILEFMRYSVPTFGAYLFDGGKVSDIDYVLNNETWYSMFNSLSVFVPSDLMQELADGIKEKFNVSIDINDN